MPPRMPKMQSGMKMMSVRRRVPSLAYCDAWRLMARRAARIVMTITAAKTAKRYQWLTVSAPKTL